MRNFQFVGPIDPLPLLIELQRQPELWNENKARRKQAIHAQTDDIWLRWTEKDDLDYDTGALDLKFLPAWYKLPSARPIIFALMTRMQAIELGAIFITRIPVGKRVLPHIDLGWHAKRFESKVYVALQSNPECVNYAEDEQVAMKAGDCWMFRNTVNHSVINAGVDDRISLIVGMRCED